MTIGLISSTTVPAWALDAFNDGLRTQGWEGDPGVSPGSNEPVTVLSYGANGDYAKLPTTITAWDNNPDVDVIVAVGGLVSAHAAVQNCQQTAFLVLFGTEPEFNLGNNANYKGGVNLDMIAKDVDRNRELCRFAGIADPKKISLIWSARSLMGIRERKAWVTDNRWPLNERVPKNADGDISAAIADAKSNGAKGIVVSGDPFFTSRMNTLVTAANASGMKVCYPFSLYKNASPPPTPGSGICLGPDLMHAYKVMGEKAGTILTALADSQPAPFTGLFVEPTGAVQPLRAKTSSAKKKPMKPKKAKKKANK